MEFITVQGVFNYAEESYVVDVSIDFLACRISFRLTKNMASDPSEVFVITFEHMANLDFFSAYAGRDLPEYDAKKDYLEITEIGYLKPEFRSELLFSQTSGIKCIQPNIYIELNTSPCYLFAKSIVCGGMRFSLSKK